MGKYGFILFFFGIKLCLCSNNDFSPSAPENDQLTRVEALLEIVINKNQDLEKRVEHLEIELQKYVKVNKNLMDKISEMETKQRGESSNGKQESEEYTMTQGVQMTTNDDNKTQVHITEKRREPPKLGEQNYRRDKKRLLDPSPTSQLASVRQTPVAFTAFLSKDVTGLGQGQSIVFDNVITNVGGGYHKSHGNFIAPTDGVYVFTLTAMVKSGQVQYLNIVKEGVNVVEMYVSSPSIHRQYHSATGVIVLALSRGDEVWVRTPNASWHGTGSLHGGFYTSFSGWLLHQ